VKLLVVIPAYNEEEALPSVLRELDEQRKALPHTIDAVVIDDGSGDHTSEVAFSAGARVVRLCRNLGIGGAVQAGLRVALREGYDVAVQLDGDGQHPPAELAKLLATQNGPGSPDLVVGTRFATKGGFRSTPMRRLGAWWMRVILRVLGLKVTDPTSGYRLYGRRALELYDWAYPYDYPEPEALAMARAAKLKVLEVPVTMRERQGGTSSIAGLSAPYYMLKVTLAVVLAFVRSRARTQGD
jgi:glycosyltransferase involved in cell wall biosynthesis